jgi:hypothetical protein
VYHKAPKHDSGCVYLLSYHDICWLTFLSLSLSLIYFLQIIQNFTFICASCNVDDEYLDCHYHAMGSL